MKNLRVYLFFIFVSMGFSCNDILEKEDSLEYKNLSTANNLPFTRELEYMKAELSISREIKENKLSGNFYFLKNLLIGLNGNDSLRDLWELIKILGEYIGGYNFIISPLASILEEYYNQFYLFLPIAENYFKSGEANPFKNRFEEFIESLKILKELCFDFTEERFDGFIPKLKKDHLPWHLIDDFFLEHKKKGSGFFKFCATPLSEVFDEFIQLGDLLMEGELVQAKQLGDKIEKKYIPKLEYYRRDFHIALSEMKMNYYLGIIDEIYVEHVRRLICEGNLQTENTAMKLKTQEGGSFPGMRLKTKEEIKAEQGEKSEPTFGPVMRVNGEAFKQEVERSQEVSSEKYKSLFEIILPSFCLPYIF